MTFTASSGSMPQQRVSADLPFGGTKRSGLGREHGLLVGPPDMEELLDQRLFHVER